MKTYWLVAWRWVIHFGRPERIIVVRPVDVTDTSRYHPMNVFADHGAACDKADSYRYQRTNGAVREPSDPERVWPPDMVS